ncbi:DUF3800 domain-containing protein [Actinomadura sp. WMMA1423]|uniref:DUF3800 domain-containing protein n=1 Tax=Actinomadura sp. WMMA1423 TaxID=2591108 RepID=UPI00143DD609|nr:DUF3800 domain-containing protein [Actinomadura sp. WMMA1423]
MDEAGQRSRTPKSSDHFVMSAVIIDDEHLAEASDCLAKLRVDLGRRPDDHLTWKNLRGHSLRLHASQVLGQQPWLTISSVVVCKRHITQGIEGIDDDLAYLYTVRYLLERLSWHARDRSRQSSYTLAHVIRFRMEKLREYERLLRADPDCKIAWTALDPRGGQLDQPQRLEFLQLADLAASATFAAFEPDHYGNTERRYLENFSERLYRRGENLTSYGLKMHPWCSSTKAAYPWVAAL